MRIAKPVLVVATPIGVAGGLYEGYCLTGGLVLLMAVMLAFIGVAVASVVAVVRHERAAEAAAARPPEHRDPDPPHQ